MPDLASENERFFLYLGYDLVITTIERRRATEHDVQHDTDAPHVTLLCVVTIEDLWSNVVGCTVHLMHRIVVLIEVVRSAKIDDFDGATIVDIN